MASSVLKMGNPSLRDQAAEVERFSTIQLYKLLKRMKESLYSQHGVGISAPQLGVNQRVVMFGFNGNPRYPGEKPIPFTILINPEYKPVVAAKVEDWESCLSIPGLCGRVARYLQIEYSGFNPEGKAVSGVAEGFHARVIQHECDHLNGILYPSRITDMRDFGFTDVLWGSLYGHEKEKRHLAVL